MQPEHCWNASLTRTGSDLIYMLTGRRPDPRPLSVSDTYGWTREEFIARAAVFYEKTTDAPRELVRAHLNVWTETSQPSRRP